MNNKATSITEKDQGFRGYFPHGKKSGARGTGGERERDRMRDGKTRGRGALGGLILVFKCPDPTVPCYFCSQLSSAN